jgi:hypothetical protein
MKAIIMPDHFLQRCGMPNQCEEDHDSIEKPPRAFDMGGRILLYYISNNHVESPPTLVQILVSEY